MKTFTKHALSLGLLMSLFGALQAMDVQEKAVLIVHPDMQLESVVVRSSDGKEFELSGNEVLLSDLLVRKVKEQPLSTKPTIHVDLDSSLLEKVVAVLKWQALLSPKELVSIKSSTLSEGDIAECGALIKALFALNIPIALMVASSEKKEDVRLIPLRIARQSNALKRLLQDVQEIREPIVFGNISHEIFCTVLFLLEKLDEIAEQEKTMKRLYKENYKEWCNLITVKPTPYIHTYLNACLEKDLSQAWDERKERGLAISFRAVVLLLAANYLDIEPLMNAAARALALQLIKDNGLLDSNVKRGVVSVVRGTPNHIPDCILALINKEHGLYGQENPRSDNIMGFVDGVQVWGYRWQELIREKWQFAMEEIDKLGYACLKRIPKSLHGRLMDTLKKIDQ